MESIQYGQYKVPKAYEMINFGVGQPANKFLPLKIIKKAMTKMMNITDPSLLQYGNIQGYYQFRKCLANYLSVKYEIDNINPDSLFISNGVTGSLSLICSLFTNKNTIVIVEEPTYFLAINVFKDFNLKILTIPIGNDGADLNELENIVRNNPNNNILFYTIPTFHNPTSYTMSNEKRIKLANIAEIHNDFLIIADEVYQLLYFYDKPPLPLYHFSNKAISLGSFSKILAPSLRLGWIQTSKHIMKKIISCGQLDSSGGVNPFISSMVHQVIDSGDQELHVNCIRNELSERCRTICNAVDKFLISYVEYDRPKGGYFVWLKLKNNINSNDLLEHCIKNKVKFHNGIKFSKNGKCQNYFRISFSYYDSNDLVTGITRLSESIKSLMTIKISIMGYKGRLGSKIVSELKNYDNMKFVSGINHDIKINLFGNKNIIIDVSSPKGTINLFEYLIENNINVPVIVGTTGDLPLSLIKKYSKNNPVAVISNFSNGIPNLINFIKYIRNQNWNVEINETHHINKKDVPSGTAKTLANTFQKQVKINSFRHGEIFGIHTINMDNKNENIQITHIAKNRCLFAHGAIDYAKWILNKPNGIYHSKTNKKIKFYKYNGCGNDFILIDNRKYNIIDKPIFVQKISNRRTSIGADGVIFIEYNDELNFAWEFYNSDGTNVEMCGNGARCVSKFGHDFLKINNPIRFSNNFGIITYGYVNNNEVKCLLPNPKIHCSSKYKSLSNFLKIHRYDISPNIHVTDVKVPHLVITTKINISEFNLEKFSKIVNKWLKINKMSYININLCNIFENEIINRTYERGVFRETLSCGTGCIAVAFIAQKYYGKNTNPIYVKVRSGDSLKIIFKENKTYLEGIVNNIYTGEINNHF